jgi:hypothetical protein
MRNFSGWTRTGREIAVEGAACGPMEPEQSAELAGCCPLSLELLAVLQNWVKLECPRIANYPGGSSSMVDAFKKGA